VEYYYANNTNGGNTVKKIISFILLFLVIIGAGVVGYISAKNDADPREVFGLISVCGGILLWVIFELLFDKKPETESEPVDKSICAVCRTAEGTITDCAFYIDKGLAVCEKCCERCYNTEPFPCLSREKRGEKINV
jgi:hypothetical protein